VAKENLGEGSGLLAAAALMIDYVLTVAVGISAGVGALVSVAPKLLPHTLIICLAILTLITIVNLRGVKEAGGVFMIPTYIFLGTLLIAIAIGLFKTWASGGHPAAVVPPPSIPAAAVTVSVWIILKAFASGCTAMTGVEAVSNGVKAFHEPTAETARRTLTIIIALLIVLLLGIAYLVRAYGIAATDPGAAGYKSVLAMLVAAVTGEGVFYYVTMGSILVVLSLSANTAFADFPRLCRVIATDDYLPRSFMSQGRRLVYTEGIYVLAALSAVLLTIFGGVTDRLIPLYAVGAFLAFTLSQFGMVFHWKKSDGGSGHFGSMFVNGLGATVTGITVVVVLVAKFTEGAWITVLLIPSLLLLMATVKRHYVHVGEELATGSPLDLTHFQHPMVVVPMEGWSKISRRALTFALTMSTEIFAVHIDCGEETDCLKDQWSQLVEKPSLEVGQPVPKLVVVPSPYRQITGPILNYVLELEKKNPERQIAVLIPELVERRWYYYFLHNQRATVLKAMLYLRGTHQTIVVNVPWYIHG
jgi:amino acid transporter